MLASDQLEHAAALLVWADVDVIIFACTTGSLVHGVGWDREVAGRIERASGRPATTTTTTVLGALRAVGATTLAVATPYLEELNAIERRFLEASGFAVAAISGLGCVTDAEAVFISCTNFHCLPAIASLERQLGKPVVTSNLAGAWTALRQIGIEDTIPGYGQLLQLPAIAEAMAP
jgi:maleate isomerase